MYFLSETMEARGCRITFLKCCQSRILYSVKISLTNEGELETFSCDETNDNSLLPGLLLKVVKEFLQKERK